MQSKNHKLAQLAAMLARNLPKESAHTCAGLAIKLTSIGSGLQAVYTFQCNGYKTDDQDKYLNKLSRENVQAANNYSHRLNVHGSSYCEKRITQLERKLTTIRTETGLKFASAGLSGVCWTMPNGSEFFI